MQQIDLPDHIIVYALGQPHVRTANLDLGFDSWLTLIWDREEADRRVVAYERGPEASLLTVYETIQEAETDIQARYGGLRFEDLDDAVEFERALASRRAA